MPEEAEKIIKDIFEKCPPIEEGDDTEAEIEDIKKVCFQDNGKMIQRVMKMESVYQKKKIRHFL